MLFSSFKSCSMLYKVLCITILLSTLQVTTQSFIHGRVLENGARSLEFVTVALYSSAYSVLQKCAVTNDKGEFVFEKVNVGKDHLVVSMVGFEKAVVPVDIAHTQTHTSPDITISETTL